MLEEQTQERNGDSQLLDTAWLEITRACNWECVHCYADSGPAIPVDGSLSTQEWERLIREAKQLGCRVLHFIGGEPTIHPAFRRLVEYAVGAELPLVEVNTNASRITDGLAKFMGGNGVSAAVSFYSADPRRHEAITRRHCSLRKTLDGLRRLVEHGVPVRVGIVEIDQSPEELAEARALLAAMGVKRIGGDRLRRIGRARTVDGRTVEGGGGEFGELCGLCAESRLCVDCDARVFACPMSRSWPLGDAREGLASSLSSPAAEDFRRRHRSAHPKMTKGDLAPGHASTCSPERPLCRPNACYPNLEPCTPDKGDPPTPCYPCIPAA